MEVSKELSYPFKYRILQPEAALTGLGLGSCHTRSNTGFYNCRNWNPRYCWASCHTRSNTGFYNLIWATFRMVVSRLSYPFKYRLLQPKPIQRKWCKNCCHTRPNTGFYNSTETYAPAGGIMGCHTRSNTGFYNRARNLRKPYSWLSYPFKYRLLQHYIPRLRYGKQRVVIPVQI